MKVTLPATASLVELANLALQQSGVEDASSQSHGLAHAIQQTPGAFTLQRTSDSISIEISPSQLTKFTGQAAGSHERSLQGCLSQMPSLKWMAARRHR